MFNNDVILILQELDNMGRTVHEIYKEPDGSFWEYIREFDSNYKKGEIPSYVVEYFNGELWYKRDHDTVLFDSMKNC